MDGCFDGRGDFKIWQGYSRLTAAQASTTIYRNFAASVSTFSVFSPRTNLPLRISHLHSITRMDLLLVKTSDSDFWLLFLIFFFSWCMCTLLQSLHSLFVLINSAMARRPPFSILCLPLRLSVMMHTNFLFVVCPY